MEFRLANAEDKPYVIQLWQECFCDDNEFIEYWFDTVYDNKKTFVATDCGVICAAAQYLEYEVFVENQIKKYAYICGVGTKESKRHNKIGSKLMLYSEEYLKDNGFDGIILISEADEFYEKLGYTVASQKYESEVDNKIQLCSNTKPSKVDKVLEIYNSYMRNFNMYIAREEYEIQRMMNVYDCIMIEDSNGDDSAYAFVDRYDNLTIIEEYAYINEYGRSAIETFFKSIKGSVKIRSDEKIGKAVRAVYIKSFDVLPNQLNGYISPLI